MSKFASFLTVVLFTVHFAAPQVAFAADQTLKIGVGESKNVRAPRRINQVQVINPRIADIVGTTTRGITVVGISGGITEVHMTLSTGRTYKVQIRVVARKAGELFEAVKGFLGPVEGIIPRIFGDLVIIDGKALTAADYGRVTKAVKLFGKKVRNFAGYQPSAVEEINKIIQAAGLSTVKANLYAGMVFVEGAVGSKTELAKARAVINNMDLKVVDLLSVGKGRQVLVEVKFIEIKKSADIKFGLKLPAAITASGSLIGQINIIPSGNHQMQLQLQTPESSMTASIDMLFKNGFARLLAKPKLVCGSGGKAKFLVGGEIPIVQRTLETFSVTYKEFGIKLQIEPIADSRGFITAKLEAEVSEPNFANSIQGMPSFVKRQVITTVTMQEGSTLVLSGLYSSSSAKTINRIPILGHIPVLGELFKSREFLREKTQLAVFITPRIINPQHPWVRRTIRTFERRYNRFKRKVEFEIFD